MFVLGVAPGSRADATALLGAAANGAGARWRDSRRRRDRRGQPSARALAALPAARRLLVVPAGRAGAPLTQEERTLLGGADAPDDEAADSLLGQAAMEADAVVVPSPSAARRLARTPALPGARRTSRWWWSALVATRLRTIRALIPRLRITIRPRMHGQGRVPQGPRASARPCGRAAHAPRGHLAAGRRFRHRSPAERPRPARRARGRVSPAHRERSRPRRARAHPRDPEPGPHGGRRRGQHQPARAAGRRRRGRLHRGRQSHRPHGGARASLWRTSIAPDAGAYGDFLVDYDARSATGTALLYAAEDSFELAGAIRRAVALRTERERWDALVTAMLISAPSWRDTSALLESLAEEAAKDVATPLLA